MSNLCIKGDFALHISSKAPAFVTFLKGVYSQTLLSFSTQTRVTVACHLTLIRGVQWNLGKSLNCQEVSSNSFLWTGKQLFDLLLSPDYDLRSAGVHISKGEVIYSTTASSWLHKSGGNVLFSLVKHC